MFRYDDAVADRYPTIQAGVLRATGLINGPSPPELLAAYRAAQRAAADRLSRMAVVDIPSITAWRGAFARFGVDPTRHRSAPEALLRRLAKRGDIPSISTLVDVGNLVSIRHAVSVAVFDQGNVAGSITVRFAKGDELFTDLGSSEGVHPDQGEVVFVDDEDVVMARRWCWRQSQQGATSATTVAALFVIEGHHDTAERDIHAALADLTALLASHQPHHRAERYQVSATKLSVADGGGDTGHNGPSP